MNRDKVLQVTYDLFHLWKSRVQGSDKEVHSYTCEVAEQWARKKPQQMRLIWPWKMSLLSSFMIQLTKMCKWLIVWGFSGCHGYGLNRPSWRLPSSPIHTPARHEVYLSNEWPSLNMIMRGCAPVPLCQTNSRLFEHCHLKRQRYLFVIMQRRQTTHVILLRWIT